MEATDKKTLLKRIKDAFLGEAIPAAPVAPPAAPVQAATPITTGIASPFKLKDGTDITITIDDPAVSSVPDPGDMVMINGAPAPAGDYELEDGSKFTVDSTGMITVFTATAPVTQPEFVAPPTPPTLEERVKALEAKGGFSSSTPAPIGEVPTTVKGIRALYAAFAVGTPEERIANLEMVAKALMEATFGWQLREAEQKATADQAMTIYKQGLVTAPAQMEKHEQTIKDMFGLLELLVENPTADPKTLNGQKKESFLAAKEKRIEVVANAITQLRKESKINL
jgi:hypothetical protein